MVGRRERRTTTERASGGFEVGRPTSRAGRDDAPRLRTEEVRLVERPARDVLQGLEDVHLAVLGDLAKVEGAVADAPVARHVRVDVFDRAPELVADDHLALALLRLLRQVQDHDGGAVARDEVPEVGLGRRVGRVDAIEDDRRLGHRDRRLLRPERRDRAPDLHEAREDPLAHALLVGDLLEFDVVGDLAAVAHAALQVPRPRKVAAPPRDESHVHDAAEEGALPLHKGPVGQGQRPALRARRLQRLAELAREVRVPRVHGLPRGLARDASSNFEDLASRSFATRFGSVLDERSSLGANATRGCFPLGSRSETTHVEATSKRPVPARLGALVFVASSWRAGSALVMLCCNVRVRS